MTAISTVLSVSALTAAAMAGFVQGTDAQTDRGSRLSQAKPAAAVATWKCPFSVVELAPVSRDTSGQPTAWVMVHRVNGEVVAAERVSPREVEQVRSQPCRADAEAGPSLVG